MRHSAILPLLSCTLLAGGAALAGKPGSDIAFPADFEMTECWGATTVDPGCPWTESILHEDGTWEHVVLHIPGVGDLPYTLYGSWELRKGGKELTIEYVGDVVTTTWVGTRTSDGCFEGTMSDTSSDPNEGVWEGCVVM